MTRNLCFFLSIFSFFVVLTNAESSWNILNQRTKNGVNISLRNYCESWKLNVELHNIREFQVVPEECIGYIGKYITSTQYKVDSERAIEEAIVYLSTGCDLKNDRRDAWIFDIDDTLLSTVPYYKGHHFGGEKTNQTTMEDWMSQAMAPALEHSLKLFDEIKARGLQIILVSARREHLRSSTINNLIHVGFYGWTSLVLRDPNDEVNWVQDFKADGRKQLMGNGYRIWGILGDQIAASRGFLKQTGHSNSQIQCTTFLE